MAPRARAGMLVRNYRSHASLLRVPNQLFYEDRLEAAAPQDALLAPPAWGPLRIGSGAPVTSDFIWCMSES